MQVQELQLKGYAMQVQELPLKGYAMQVQANMEESQVVRWVLRNGNVQEPTPQQVPQVPMP